jgi:hypothetical protein
MTGTEGKTPPADEGAEAAFKAAAEVLHPAIPPAGAAILIEADPRLHQPSESEEELKELVESNEAADADSADGTAIDR